MNIKKAILRLIYRNTNEILRYINDRTLKTTKHTFQFTTLAKHNTVNRSTIVKVKARL